ncbi:hypothetical protein HWC53_gp213 [Bacillus phage vB_BmeM-Goe8]|uniref:Uncharacterized protein n=1 Tax=Bacillus phage vB_BmeM-Goe8 TaxID=2593638 RepID=A0A516KMR6_9CAUD|nr:hypothetical protein HWC53_gp213 [Bacillus phage vB_BmeM-Goe8]QDP42876.1 hypothetical protein Goe8_c01030 [Bacillus phage vB_BmeM-Goe8]
MPLEKRDPHSKARIFIPTQRERSLVESQRLLKQNLEDVEAIKKELQDLLDKAKKK